jgi:phosphoribosylamine--glycine ligase
VRDLIERRTNIPIICPTKECAIEESKIKQRILFESTVPEVNPRFRIFDPKDYKSTTDIRTAVFRWLDELNDQAVVKPDNPTAGKGVGVWGDHFTTREQLFEHFLSNFHFGSVIIEEKIEGEESSFQAFCDGRHLVALPDTRDYKRAFDGDKGPNTGGMGSYKNIGDVLPFMTENERSKENSIANRIIDKWKEKMADSAGLRGIPLYLAFMHTGSGPKILENNSRPGDPEIINILPILKDDFVDVCFRILEGNLTSIELKKNANVVTYKVPPSYAGYADISPSHIEEAEVDSPVDLTKAYELVRTKSDNIRVYPAAMETRNGEAYALKSRAVSVVGMGDTIEVARQFSLEGIKAITGGALWYRTDIASKQHIENSIKHMEKLRRNA